MKKEGKLGNQCIVTLGQEFTLEEEMATHCMGLPQGHQLRGQGTDAISGQHERTYSPGNTEGPSGTISTPDTFGSVEGCGTNPPDARLARLLDQHC